MVASRPIKDSDNLDAPRCRRPFSLPLSCGIMRILLVSYAYPPFLAMGGPPEKVRHIARLLARHGHDVTVLTPKHSLSLRTTVSHEAGVEVVRLGSVARYRYTVTLNPGVVRFCLRRLHEFHVVHVFGLYELIGPVVTSFARRRHIPYLLEAMGMYRPVGRSVLKKRLYHLVAGRPLVAGAAMLVATSQYEADALLADGVAASRVEMRRDGVDLTAFEASASRGHFRETLGIPPDAWLVLYLGRLTPGKNPDLLLEAFARLDFPNARLAFVGPSEDGQREALERRAASLGVSARVIFPGPLYGSDKVDALAAADLFVLPSSSESFGIAAVEAMASSVSVVVTDRCGVAPFVVGRAGLVVPLGLEPLTAAIRELLLDERRRSDFARMAPQVARSLSWEEPVQQLEALYRRVAPEPPARGASEARTH